MHDKPFILEFNIFAWYKLILSDTSKKSSDYRLFEVTNVLLITGFPFKKVDRICA